MTEHDPVNHPQHYQSESGLEAIEVIEAFARDNYLRGNALKYLLRAGSKDDLAQDLRKAIWYIEREIAGTNSKSPQVRPSSFALFELERAKSRQWGIAHCLESEDRYQYIYSDVIDCWTEFRDGAPTGEVFNDNEMLDALMEDWVEVSKLG